MYVYSEKWATELKTVIYVNFPMYVRYILLKIHDCDPLQILNSVAFTETAEY